MMMTMILKAARLYFGMQRDATVLEEDAANIVTAFGITLDYALIEGLDDRIELLEEAVFEIEQCMPCSAEQRKGTLFGATLQEFPKGKKIIVEAKSHLANAKLTHEFLASFHTARTAFAQTIDDLGNDLLAGGVPLSGALSALQTLHSSFKTCSERCLNEFKPENTEGVLATAMSQWVELLHTVGARIEGNPVPPRVLL